MNQKQAEIASEWLGAVGTSINRSCNYMKSLRNLSWMKEGEWELETREIEDKLWILDEEIDRLLGEFYELADL